MAEPTCPNCSVAGIEHFVSKRSSERSRTGQPWFVVVYCDSCGHVYDVIAKHTFTQQTQPRFVLPKT
jgi:uncharacterized Zn finger protein